LKSAAADLEVAGEHVQKVLRLHVKYNLVSVILAHLAVTDLLDRDIGESGVIELTAKGSGQRVDFCARPRLYWRCIHLVAERSAESVMLSWLS
jgi:hypothetical protein